MSVKMEAVSRFLCEKPVLYENEVLNLFWDIQQANRFTLEYVDKGALIRFDSDLQDLPLSGKKRLEGVTQDTLFTLTSYDKNIRVYQKQINVQVLHGPRPSLDTDILRTFINKAKADSHSNGAILPDMVSRFNVDLFNGDELECIVSLLNNNEPEDWGLFNDIVSLLEPAYTERLALNKMLESIAVKLKLYTSSHVIEFIKGLDVRCLDGGLKSDLDAVLSQVLTPVLQNFVNKNQFYWFYCVAMAFKSLNIDEQLVSRALHRFFRANNWEYEIKYGALLTLIFHVSDNPANNAFMSADNKLAELPVKPLSPANASTTETGVIPESIEPATKATSKNEDGISEQQADLLAEQKIDSMADSIISELKKIGVESLIASRPGRLLADYQKEMYEQCFSKLVDRFPCSSPESMNQWVMDMAQGLKSSGVGQITALFCFEKYITAHGWEFDLDLSEQLIELYQFTTSGTN